jgi:hypothetical protein
VSQGETRLVLLLLLPVFMRDGVGTGKSDVLERIVEGGGKLRGG